MARVKNNEGLAVGYLRVSTEEQKLGPVAQAQALEVWAEREGVTLVAVYFDFGLSGALPATKRPGLTAALTALREAKAGLLVAANRSRIARSIEVIRAIEASASQAGGKLTTTDGMSDATGSTGKLSKGLIDLVHEWERGVISERVSAALAVKKSRGERVGQVPYGFDVSDDEVHLVPNEAEQATLGLVRSLSASGLSTRKIATHLAEQGHATRKGTPFAQTQIVRLLRAG